MRISMPLSPVAIVFTREDRGRRGAGGSPRCRSWRAAASGLEAEAHAAAGRARVAADGHAPQVETLDEALDQRADRRADHRAVGASDRLERAAAEGHVTAGGARLE